MARAVNAGDSVIVAVAVATDADPPASPCGACRQTLAEFAADSAEVLLVGRGTARASTTLGALLPSAFRPDALEKK